LPFVVSMVLITTNVFLEVGTYQLIILFFVFCLSSLLDQHRFTYFAAPQVPLFRWKLETEHVIVQYTCTIVQYWASEALTTSRPSLLFLAV
jgi:hypothetical protein